jgi:dipeptide/tripeptide permease
VQPTTNEQFLPFWGDEKLDKNVEGFVRNYSEEVYRELSCFSTRGRRAVAIIFLFIQPTIFWNSTSYE